MLNLTQIYNNMNINFNNWEDIDHEYMSDLITKINSLNINESINIKISNKCLNKIKILINSCKIQPLHLMYKLLKEFKTNNVFMIIKIYKSNNFLFTHVTKSNNYINLCDFI